MSHGDITVNAGMAISSTAGALGVTLLAGYSYDDNPATPVNSLSGGSVIMGAGSSIGGQRRRGHDQGRSLTASGISLNEASINGASSATLLGSTTNANSYGVFLDRSTIAANGNLSVTSSSGAAKLIGSTLSSQGGALSASATGSSNFNSLAIVSYTGTPAVPSQILNTGAGTITLSGDLTSGGASAGTPTAGVVISGSTVAGGSGDITITGQAGVPSGVARDSRGVLLNTASRVTGSGKITMTGAVGASASADSIGAELAAGTTVQSTGGNIKLSGTLNNPSITSGTGLMIGGRVQAAGSVELTGSATVGNQSGIGLDISSTAVIASGALGLTATGSVSSSSTATSIVATTVQGTLTSGGDINITAAVAAPSAVIAKGFSHTWAGSAARAGTSASRGRRTPASAGYVLRRRDLRRHADHCGRRHQAGGRPDVRGVHRERRHRPHDDHALQHQPPDHAGG